MRRWLTMMSWVCFLLLAGCSKAAGYQTPWWLELIGVLAVLVVLILIVVSVAGALFGTNKLFSKFLTEVCDAKKPAYPFSPLEAKTLPAEAVNSSDEVRVALGATLTIFSMCLLAAVPFAPQGSKDFGVAGWPLYWAMIFGPYYVARYWSAPRRGGSSSRIVLLLVCSAIVFGWAYHIGL